MVSRTGIGAGIGIPFRNIASGGGKPYLSPEVKEALKAVVIAYGKTNNDSDRAIVKNLVDASNPFVISNAAFKLNSGFGKYSADFESFDWTINISQKQHNKATISLNGRLCNHAAIEVDEMKVNIIGNVTELIYWYIANPDDTTRSEIRLTSGINTLPKSYAKDDGQTYNIGFAYISGDSEITIEQIPSFEGAFVTDGVNDLITSTKTVQEMLRGSSEYTVLSMIHHIDVPEGNIHSNTVRIKLGSWGTSNRITSFSNNKTGIYGYTVKNQNITVINNILGDKNDYGIRGGDYTSNLEAKFSVVGWIGEDDILRETASVAWYWTIIANKVLTTDQINQVISYFNLDKTLKPDILCNTIKQGITNENHAEFGDKLIDFSGNGRDIQLNNIVWKGDSGIGKYDEDFTTWYNASGMLRTSSKVELIDGFKHNWVINKRSGESTINSFKVLIKGIPESGYIQYRYFESEDATKKSSIDIYEDGEYSLPNSTLNNLNDLVGFQLFAKIPPLDSQSFIGLTITQIPSHAGALCLDGVNDFGQFVGDLELKDYTFIADRAYSRIAPSQVPFIASTQTNGQAPFLMEYLNEDTYVYPHSFGTTTKTTNLNIQRQISYQSTYVYNGNSISKGTSVDTGDGLTIGNSGSTGLQYSPLCLWSLMLFPYSMSEFLIERQLKKHKLGTLYPDMVEFRPVIKQDNRIKSIKYYIDGKTANIGQYYPIGTGLGIAVETVQPYMVKSLKVNGVNTIPNADYKGFNARLDSKSPQKITMDIQVNSSLVQWNPVVESNAEYKVVDCYIDTLPAVVGNYYPINSKLRIAVTTKGAADEVTSLTVNGVSLGTPSVDGNRFSFNGTLSDKSPQKINITIDEYIRFEDIVQPYPVLLKFNDENGNEVSWGGKFRVGSTITRIGSIADPESNLLNGLYSVSGLSLNGKVVTNSTSIVEKQMVFKTTTTYLLDNNEPKCILSPRLLRIPNSSYKILGYIPDISGHGNHGVIHNSAYAKGSGVNEDGSYQFDGVNDFVTIPTLSSGGKQVLMKVNWQNDYNVPGYMYDSNTGEYRNYIIKGNKEQIAYENASKTYIDGIQNSNITSGGLKDITHNITSQFNGTSGTSYIGCRYSLENFLKMALYDFMLFDNISTDDKIKELNEYVGIEAKVELPPYYWDAYGKTNLDVDKTTIQQRGVAEGDYDITNYNHAYDKMSGYGGYNLSRFDKSWSSSSNTSIKVVQRNPYDITLKKLVGNSDWEFNNTELKVISNPVSVKFKSNKNIRVTCDYHYYPVGGNSEGVPLGITSKDLIANKDAIITISPISQENIDKYNIDVNRGYYLIYFQLSSTLAVNEEVTIEMLPLYPNGLVYDGVADYSENANIPAFTDYTYIFKRELLNLDKVGGGASLYKGSFYSNGGRAFIVDINDKNPNSEMSGYSYGNRASTSTLKTNKIIYGTKTSVNGVSVTPGSNTDNASLTLGKWDVNYKQMVFYKLILYPKTIPLLQINFLKNLMERDEIIDLTNKIFIQE